MYTCTTRPALCISHPPGVMTEQLFNLRPAIVESLHLNQKIAKNVPILVPIRGGSSVYSSDVLSLIYSSSEKNSLSPPIWQPKFYLTLHMGWWYGSG